MVTHYYRSKNELVVDALRSLGTRFRASVSPGTGAGMSRLKRRFDLRFGAAEEDLPSWEYFMEFWAASSRSEELRQRHVELSRGTRDGMRQDFEKEAEEKDTGLELDAGLAADITYALYYGLGILSTLNPQTYTPEQCKAIYTAAIDRLLEDESSA
jgi:hypothetical protein